MAFKDVGAAGTYKKLTEMQVGESVEGFVLGFPEGKHGKNILMEIEGKEVTVNSSGNIKYLIKDNKIKEGLLTRITRLADEKVKGMKSTKFKVEQDPDTSIGSVASQAAAASSSAESMRSKIDKLKNG